MNERTGWNTKRSIVFERDHGICQVCGLDIIKFEDYHNIENFYECGHKVDRVCGGSDELDNLVVMCTRCNRFKPLHNNENEYQTWIDNGGIIYDLTNFFSKNTRKENLEHFQSIDNEINGYFNELMNITSLTYFLESRFEIYYDIKTHMNKWIIDNAEYDSFNNLGINNPIKGTLQPWGRS